MTQNIKLNRGDVWLANLNPNKGVEPGKSRPVLVLQDQALLDVGHPSTLILPLTTRLIDDAYPMRIRINARDQLLQDSDILIDQLRAIDNKRFISGPLTSVAKMDLSCIDDAICEVLGI